MKKSSFVAMVLGTVGGILFALGMCMSLIPQWGLEQKGIGMGVFGVIVLIVTALVWWKMEKKQPIHASRKTIGAILLGLIGAVLLGIGLCMTMLWGLIIAGIIIGIIGIVVMLFIYPCLNGLK